MGRLQQLSAMGHWQMQVLQKPEFRRYQRLQRQRVTLPALEPGPWYCQSALEGESQFWEACEAVRFAQSATVQTPQRWDAEQLQSSTGADMPLGAPQLACRQSTPLVVMGTDRADAAMSMSYGWRSGLSRLWRADCT